MSDLDRVDLADLHDPKQLARALHKQLGTLDGPVPIADIAVALGIGDVRTVPLDGCEGILLTDRPRSRGTILVNNGRGPQAARFGIGHELGHFLLERHELGLDGKFVCNLDDLRQTRTARQYKKQEVEANEFAIAVLAPHYRTAPFLDQQPEIVAVQAMAKALDLSLEATMRCFVDQHDEPLAAIWMTNGNIRYMVPGTRFPWITRDYRQKVSALSRTHAAFAKGGQAVSTMAEVPAAAWTPDDIPELFEQVRIGREGHSLALLWATLPDGDEDDD